MPRRSGSVIRPSTFNGSNFCSDITTDRNVPNPWSFTSSPSATVAAIRSRNSSTQSFATRCGTPTLAAVSRTSSLFVLAIVAASL